MASRPSSGLNWVAGGVAAAVLVPALSLGANFPFLLSCAIAALACGGIVIVFTPRRPFDRFDGSGIARGKIEFAAELLGEAEPLVGRIEAAGKAIRTGKIADRVRHLAGIARDILDGVEKDPLKASRVRRFITYYLPRAAEMAEAYGLLETQALPSRERLNGTSELIDRLDIAFTRYADSLVDADLDKLDVELKLLKSALDEDLGPAAPNAAPSESPKRSA